MLALDLPALPPSAPLAYGAACILFAAVLRGMTGFGFAVAAVPLLSVVAPPSFVVPIAICLQFLGGLIDGRSALADCHRESLKWLTVGALIGSPVGILALTLISAPAARLVIGVLTGLAVLMLGRGLGFSQVPGPRIALPVGLASGLFNGLAAMPGPPVVAFYYSAPLARLRVRASLIVFFLINAVVALVSGVAFGIVGRNVLWATAAAFPLMYVGTRLGGRFASWGSDAAHRRFAAWFLAATALIAIGRGLADLL